MAAQKKKERQERFGIETKESIEAKRQERLKRFANGMDQATQHAASGMDADEVESRRAARLIRFGQAEVEESKKAGESGLNRKRKFNQRHGKQNTRGKSQG